MNILHKETLIVVVTTLVTSGMILLTGNSVADSAVETFKSKDVFASADKNASQFVYDKNVTIAPPPGPFLNLGALVVNTRIMKLSPAIAPIQPIKKIKRPVQPNMSMKFGVVPAQPKKVIGTKVELKKPVMPFAPLRPSFSLERLEAPKLIQKKRLAPNFMNMASPAAPVNSYQKPAMNASKLPIWMQQDHNKINALKLNQRRMPTTNSKGLNNRFIQRQAPNMGSSRVGNFPVQQYMYIPIPMLQPSFAMPQAPVLRASSAPMPAATNNKQNINQSMPNISESINKDNN